MNFEMRLALLKFNGTQHFPGCTDLALFTDADTGSTFSVKPGQTVGEALLEFADRWAEAEAKAKIVRPEEQAA